MHVYEIASPSAQNRSKPRTHPRGIQNNRCALRERGFELLGHHIENALAATLTLERKTLADGVELMSTALYSRASREARVDLPAPIVPVTAMRTRLPPVVTAQPNENGFQSLKASMYATISQDIVESNTSTAEPRLAKNHRLVNDILREQERGKHLSVADLYALARGRRPGIGFTTVYRALARLRDLV